MSNPHEYLPDPATVQPLALAREAVLHHAGCNGLAVYHPDGGYFETRDLYDAEKPTPAPWVADDHPDWAQPTLEIRTARGRSIARVRLVDGEIEIGTCMTVGKAEIEWANAALIARMRTREPIIAAECIRLEAENRRLLALLKSAGRELDEAQRGRR